MGKTPSAFAEKPLLVWTLGGDLGRQGLRVGSRQGEWRFHRLLMGRSCCAGALLPVAIVGARNSVVLGICLVDTPGCLLWGSGWGRKTQWDGLAGGQLLRPSRPWCEGEECSLSPTCCQDYYFDAR